MRIRGIIVGVLVIAVAMAAAAPAFGSNHARNPRVLPIGAKFRGESYADLQVRWNRWFGSMPAETNPLLDETGERCHNGQSGRVWFSAPVAHLGTTERACTLQEGTALLVLDRANECSTLEAPPFFGSTDPELLACAAAGFEPGGGFAGSTASLTIDGRTITNLDDYRVETPVYGVTWVPGNVAGATAGTGRAASDGSYLLIRRLREGSHRIELHVDLPGQGSLDENYTIKIVDD